ncbi:hypothetical protein Q3G72_022933 [Acer saccharum]|nr:hypothetical protein Q3G72_022933 [Acer saccharum]
MGDAEKPVLMVAVDDSVHSYYALEWTLDHFFAAYGPDHPFKLKLVHARPTPFPSSDSPDPVSVDPYQVNDVSVIVREGDARDVMIEALEKHKASILVLGSHGYGVVKRQVIIIRVILGSVSDYCAHHCNCTVMIVKKLKSGHGH